MVNCKGQKSKLQTAKGKAQALYCEGLDEGQPPHDAARNHDVYLYGKAIS
jgi:hypothetical protein